MSDGVDSPAGATEAPKAKVPLLSLMVAMVLSVVVATGAIGGALAWAVKTNRLPLAGTTKTEVVEAPEPTPTKLVPLDPLLVNLADTDGHSYLRVSVTLKVEDPPPVKGAKPKEEKETKGPAKNEFDASERDVALELLGKETSVELLAPDGKLKLKKELEAALKEKVPEVKVIEVLITEFLVQR